MHNKSVLWVLVAVAAIGALSMLCIALGVPPGGQELAGVPGTNRR